MGIIWAWFAVLLYLALFLTPFPILVTAQPTGVYLTANSSTSWTLNNPAYFYEIFVSPSNSSVPDFGCGFFGCQTCNNIYLFALLSTAHNDKFIVYNPEVVWSTNTNKPIRTNTTLKLTSDRGLVLQDADGRIAWSTNIIRKSVAGLKLTDTGNLMLLDEHNATIWQSFDHPTNTMHVGQKLVPVQNLTSEGGSFSLSLTSQGLFAYINSNPAQRYYSFPFTNSYKISYVQFQNQILAFFGVDSLSPDKPYRELEIELASPLVQCKYMRFEPDGHLSVRWRLDASGICPHK